ncbi:MAG: class I SAM-dependent methyltransferase [Chitinispirillaceae bacterium]
MRPLLTIVSFFAVVNSAAARPRPDVDVPFVPTPLEVVNRMLDMADVGEGDLLFELSCGDGRITISAAGRGARAIGIDKNSQRIKECRQNAQMAGVSKNTKFYQSDLFGVPLAQATVIAIYLMPDVNIQLRPKLFNELKPGSRVVSHDFHMGEWEPDSVVQVRNSTVYMWVMPANFSGSWSWYHVDDPQTRFSLNISQHFQQLAGEITSDTNPACVEKMTVSGDEIKIVLKDEEQKRIHLAGIITDDRIEGTITLFNGSKLKWHAVRENGTKKPLFFPEDGI